MNYHLPDMSRAVRMDMQHSLINARRLTAEQQRERERTRDLQLKAETLRRDYPFLKSIKLGKLMWAISSFSYPTIRAMAANNLSKFLFNKALSRLARKEMDAEETPQLATASETAQT